MAYKNPPKHTRFTKENQPAKGHTQKHPNGYLVPLIKRFLEKKITYDDPETQKKITGRVKDAIIWRLLLNACQGENQAIKEILDRTDGKVVQELQGKGFGDTKVIIVKPAEDNAGNNIRKEIPKALP